jgi:hypothetical protein
MTDVQNERPDRVNVAPERETGPDFKDFVEHLRTIHFALLAVCLGLIVVTTAPGGREIALAHQQIKDIIEAERTWSVRFVTPEAGIAVEAAKKDKPYLLHEWIVEYKPDAIQWRNKHRLVHFQNAPWVVMAPDLDQWKPSEKSIGWTTRTP